MGFGSMTEEFLKGWLQTERSAVGPTVYVAFSKQTWIAIAKFLESLPSASYFMFNIL